ncbi:Protein plant cadmium resistance 6 [Vitis vinifera]|uniref:Protein plant cadmium resistance 6 n=1 Tax=Vitis vinifera TaxID=29760 RepID=A0A438JYF9_VITVI|nr:Protein plant cadmium resistance 6 [Vitis vinifera]
MGRIQDQSQNQAEYELQPQEYQSEPTQDLTLALDHDQLQQEEYPQGPKHPSDAMESEPQAQQQFQQPPQYGNPQAQPNPAYMPQQTQQVSRPQNPQMNAMNANQLAPFPPQSPQSLPLQQSPQLHVFPHGPFQPQGFGTGMHGYQSPSPVPFPPASGEYQGVLASPHKPPAAAEYWTSGLFDCMNDPTNALVTVFFPCVTFGQVAEIVDRGHTSCGTSGLLYGLIAFLIGLPCIMSCTYRTKMRSMYNLSESPGPDWVVHCLCECCALCQEYRELQARGFDPSIGWIGNVARSQNIQMQHGAMVPPRSQTMMG